MSHSHGMSGMGGMDMGMGLFVQDNQKIARVLWYLVAAAAATRGTRALIDYARTRLMSRKHSARHTVPSRPTNIVSKSYEATLAIFRELSYPALKPFQGRISRFLTPPPLGQSLLILAYFVVMLIMLFSNVWLGPRSPIYGYKWEKPAFRAGWVSVTQLPLVYALSCKFNIISIVTGISYERLNWMHRWVSRILFLSIIVHWTYFMHEWVLAGFVKTQLELMPMVKYGFGAWAVIGWSVLTGFGLFRDLCYELWLLQHLGSAGVLLWLVYKHVPAYATYNVWLCIGFVVFDRTVRGVWSMKNNLAGALKGRLGYEGCITTEDNNYLKVSVLNVHFNWRPGQHVFVSIPSCGMFESHPFTIANNKVMQRKDQQIELFIKCHSGFTGKLQKQIYHQQVLNQGAVVKQVFVSGPWGIPPLGAIERSDALIFIASSTGASFTVPLLEHAIQKAQFVRQIQFFWIVRFPSQVSWFEKRLEAALTALAQLGVSKVHFKIFITGSHTDPKQGSMLTTSSKTNDSDLSDLENEKHEQTIAVKASSMPTCDQIPSSDTVAARADRCIGTLYATGRPSSWDALIRPTVETAQGETAIIACGGKAMLAEIRSYVGALSDERAVHKGTGAQSISLWTESYGW